MLSFLLAFIFAKVTVYDFGPPPTVGVGDDQPKAQKYIDKLKAWSISGYNFKGASKTESGITYKADLDTGYTFCKSQVFNSTWYTVLFGAQLTAAQVKAGVDALIAEHTKVFTRTGQLIQSYTQQTHVTPYAEQPVASQSQLQSTALGVLYQQKPDNQAKTTGSGTSPVMPDGTYLTTSQKQVLLFFKVQNGFQGTNFFREDFKAPHPITRGEIKFEFGEKLYQLWKAKYDSDAEHAREYANAILAAPGPDEALATARRWYPDPYPQIPEPHQGKLDNWRSQSLIDAMWYTLVHKFFEGSAAKKWLLSTGDAQLFENSYMDKFWGIGSNGYGLNMLGKMLMLLRAKIRTEQGQATPFDQEILAGRFPEFARDILPHIIPSTTTSVAATHLQQPFASATSHQQPMTVAAAYTYPIPINLTQYGVTKSKEWGRKTKRFWIFTSNAQNALKLSQVMRQSGLLSVEVRSGAENHVVTIDLQEVSRFKQLFQ